MAAATATTGFSYDQLVVVAESECKLEYEFVTVNQDARGNGVIRHMLTVGGIEWEVLFFNCKPEHSHASARWTYYENQVNYIQIRCEDMQAGRIEQAHLEVLLYRWNKQKEGYAMVETPKRHKFTPEHNLMQFQLAEQPFKKMLLFHVRVLQDRASLPDFTLATTTLGHLTADVQLRVGEQPFHINKQLLSVHSEYFARMFNGGYQEANQAVVELKHEEANDPALFHDLLLIMFVPKALPNTKNMAGLLKLAQHYQAETVTEKCLNHLKICLEMPVEERILLAGEYGDKELQNFLMNNVNLEESKRINSTLFNKLFAPYGQQQNKQG